MQPATTPNYRQRFLVKQGHWLLSVEVGKITYFFLNERYRFLVAHTNKN